MFSVLYGTYRYAGAAAFAFLFYFICNLAFYLYYKVKIQKDEEFQLYLRSNKCTSKWVSIIGLFFSFKVFRLFYSYFYGIDSFKASFSSPGVFQRLIIIITSFHLIFCYVPILAIDVVGIMEMEWGT